LEAGGPAHGGAVGTGQGNSSGSGTAGAQSEDLYTLEAEITELQRENARVESQVLRLRSDITAMENQLKQGEKVSGRARSVAYRASKRQRSMVERERDSSSSASIVIVITRDVGLLFPFSKF